MVEYRRGAHTVYNLEYHVVWVTKYRYPELRGAVAERTRELIRQSCMTREVKILKGHVSKDHVHVLVSCPPALSPAKLVQLGLPRFGGQVSSAGLCFSSFLTGSQERRCSAAE